MQFITVVVALSSFFFLVVGWILPRSSGSANVTSRHSITELAELLFGLDSAFRALRVS
jgi:hypothetical protein